MTSDSAPPLGQAIAPTWTGAHTFASGTITTSVNATTTTQTWNASGTTFGAPNLVNVTATASAALSKLADWQVGGSSKAGIVKDGSMYANAGFFATAAQTASQSTALGWLFSSSRLDAYTNTANATFSFLSNDFNGASTSRISFASGGSTATGDTFLTRKGAANIQHGAADAASPVAQKISFQSVVAGNANTAAVNATIIGSLSNGSGANGDIIIQTGALGAGSGVQSTATTALTVKGGNQQVNFAAAFQVAGDTTGAGTTAGFGTNSPAGTLTGPYTWIKMISSDGSTVFLPAYK